ncbi:unnamed protein product [Timema podura]|uniref:Uncharacterized protein n=1 Tax=Timema podura TaxID=61482 RepID=A0ABN7PJA7_TIMPD|nr:unnamed protein product [Timema podura]
MNEVPDMNKRHTHFKEVYKILKAYLAKMLDKEQCKKWDSQVEPIDDAREFTEVEEMIFDNRLKDVIYLRRVGNLYILAKSIINIYPFPRNKRNSFNQIFQDECNHLLLASACKFVRSVQEILNTE